MFAPALNLSNTCGACASVSVWPSDGKSRLSLRRNFPCDSTESRNTPSTIASNPCDERALHWGRGGSSELGVGLRHVRDARGSFRDHGLPPAQLIAAGLAERVRHPSRLAQRLLDDLLAEPRDEEARVTPGVAFDEEQRPALDDERPPPEATDRSSEQRTEATLGSGPGRCKLRPPRKQPNPAPRSIGRREKPPDLVEDVVSVGSPNHEPEEVPDLLVAEPDSLARVLPVCADLPLHDIAQPEPTGHSARGILVLEDFPRKVLIADDLE